MAARPVTLVDPLAYQAAPEPLREALDAATAAERAHRKARQDVDRAQNEVNQAPAHDYAAAREAETNGKPIPAPTGEKRRTALDKAKTVAALRADDLRAAQNAAKVAARVHREGWLANLAEALDTAQEVAETWFAEARTAAMEMSALASTYGALRVAPMAGKSLPDRTSPLDVAGLDATAENLAAITRAAIDARVDKWHAEEPRETKPVAYALANSR